MKMHLSFRITGGRNAALNEYPWQVGIVDEDVEGRDILFCGGTIITMDFILTASHCVYDPTFFIEALWLGEYDKSTDKETARLTTYPKEVIPHPNYDSETNENDVALILMWKPVDFISHPNIKPACLPDITPEAGASVTATGWGLKAYNSTEQPDKLQEVDLELISVPKCNEVNFDRVKSGMICAGTPGGGAGKDACQGDSGGPLVHEVSGGVFEVVGVTSFGFGCGQLPGVYIEVKDQNPWILSHISNSSTCRKGNFGPVN